MNVYLYLEGDIVPAVFHYYMRKDGIVEEYSHKPRTKRAMMVLLERGNSVPTEAQEIAIGIMKAVNPDWVFTYFFQRTQ